MALYYAEKFKREECREFVNGLILEESENIVFNEELQVPVLPDYLVIAIDDYVTLGEPNLELPFIKIDNKGSIVIETRSPYCSLSEKYWYEILENNLVKKILREEVQVLKLEEKRLLPLLAKEPDQEIRLPHNIAFYLENIGTANVPFKTKGVKSGLLKVNTKAFLTSPPIVGITEQGILILDTQLLGITAGFKRSVLLSRESKLLPAAFAELI